MRQARSIDALLEPPTNPNTAPSRGGSGDGQQIEPVMGVDLGIGDGTRHRFVRGDGAVVFPSEQPQPSGQP